ncbi:uncharacterized protein LOC111694715 isoform X2 [Eurytemora carolleeae]|uniref:uncharacterized protein LOC111694715 isoform X2 n=1 Tax=Eurytemora carolleeae TaxID=1294199 RepID=UPI000C78F679|nr:uncharacterized protein LOC111694715 isoform X2 [Eurytemora carolleeae]|eukprot:XP_023319471.1 uncharacterized protein LOC111694715 isoform X2 [Eurytemora affinis]
MKISNIFLIFLTSVPIHGSVTRCHSDRNFTPWATGAVTYKGTTFTETGRFYDLIKYIGETVTERSINESFDKQQGHSIVRCETADIRLTEERYKECLYRVAYRVRCNNVRTVDKFCKKFQHFFQNCNNLLETCFFPEAVLRIKGAQLEALSTGLDSRSTCNIPIPEIVAVTYSPTGIPGLIDT